MGHNSQVDRALLLPAQFKALQLNPYEVLGTKGVRNKGCQSAFFANRSRKCALTPFFVTPFSGWAYQASRD